MLRTVFDAMIFQTCIAVECAGQLFLLHFEQKQLLRIDLKRKQLIFIHRVSTG